MPYRCDHAPLCDPRGEPTRRSRTRASPATYASGHSRGSATLTIASPRGPPIWCARPGHVEHGLRSGRETQVGASSEWSVGGSKESFGGPNAWMASVAACRRSGIGGQGASLVGRHKSYGSWGASRLAPRPTSTRSRPRSNLRIRHSRCLLPCVAASSECSVGCRREFHLVQLGRFREEVCHPGSTVRQVQCEVGMRQDCGAHVLAD